MQAVSSLSSVALSLNCRRCISFSGVEKIILLMLFWTHRDCEFLCRAYFPSNTQFYFRRRHVEGRQSILHLCRCAIVVDVLPVQNVQIVGSWSNVVYCMAASDFYLTDLSTSSKILPTSHFHRRLWCPANLWITSCTWGRGDIITIQFIPESSEVFVIPESWILILSENASDTISTHIVTRRSTRWGQHPSRSKAYRTYPLASESYVLFCIQVYVQLSDSHFTRYFSF